jgi:hypothetical protein
MEITEEGSFNSIFERKTTPTTITPEQKRQAQLMDWERQLKAMPIEVIEQYLRQRKLEKLNKK